MSYRVALFNYYSGGEREVCQFDTESVLIEDVQVDAEIEMLTQRMHNNKNYCERPVFQRLFAYPTFSMKGREMLKKAVVAIGLVALTPNFAEAHQPRCTMNGADMIESLNTAWGEVAVGDPLPVTPQVVEQLYANTEEGNWTRLSIGVDCSACIQSSGRGYGGIDPSKARTQPRPAVLDL